MILHWTNWSLLSLEPHKATHTILDLSFKQQETISFLFGEKRRNSSGGLGKLHLPQSERLNTRFIPVTCLTIINYFIPISFHLNQYFVVVIVNYSKLYIILQACVWFWKWNFNSQIYQNLCKPLRIIKKARFIKYKEL